MPTLLSKIDSCIGAVVPRIAHVLLGSLSCKEIEGLFRSWSHRSTNGSARGMSDIQEKLLISTLSMDTWGCVLVTSAHVSAHYKKSHTGITQSFREN
jgi:hypothetical protein